MKTMRLQAALLVMVAFAASSGIAQTDYTFTGDVSNNWRNRLNWIPDLDYPKAGDKATIPTGKTCSVQSVDDAAEIVQVDAGGTLIINGQTLTIDTNNDDTHDTPKLTVNGDLKFEGTNATLAYGNTDLGSTQFVLDGAGAVLADKLPPGLDFQGR